MLIGWWDMKGPYVATADSLLPPQHASQYSIGCRKTIRGLRSTCLVAQSRDTRRRAVARRTATGRDNSRTALLRRPMKGRPDPRRRFVLAHMGKARRELF